MEQSNEPPKKATGQELPPKPLAYTIPKALERAGGVCGRSQLYEEIFAGRLKAKKLGKRTLITDPALREWIESLPDFESGDNARRKTERDGKPAAAPRAEPNHRHAVERGAL